MYPPPPRFSGEPPQLVVAQRRERPIAPRAMAVIRDRKIRFMGWFSWVCSRNAGIKTHRSRSPLGFWGVERPAFRAQEDEATGGTPSSSGSQHPEEPVSKRRALSSRNDRADPLFRSNPEMNPGHFSALVPRLAIWPRRHPEIPKRETAKPVLSSFPKE